MLVSSWGVTAWGLMVYSSSSAVAPGLPPLCFTMSMVMVSDVSPFSDCKSFPVTVLRLV